MLDTNDKQKEKESKIKEINSIALNSYLENLKENNPELNYEIESSAKTTMNVIFSSNNAVAKIKLSAKTFQNWCNNLNEAIKDLCSQTLTSEEKKESFNKNKIKLMRFESPESLLQMIDIQGGTLLLGYGTENAEDYKTLKQHKVTIDSFKMMKYVVTQKLYEDIMKVNPSRYKDDLKPVQNVNWYDAVEFCNKLSEKEGLTPCYTIDKEHLNKDADLYDKIKWTVKCNFKANGYRLPTEAEWEYAAKGGQLTHNYDFAGSNEINDVAWYNKNNKKTVSEVGEKQPNELGLFDMSGNVFELCWNFASTDVKDNEINPTGPETGSEHAIRGGCAFAVKNVERVYHRCFICSNTKYDETGFRLVRS